MGSGLAVAEVSLDLGWDCVTGASGFLSCGSQRLVWHSFLKGTWPSEVTVRDLWPSRFSILTSVSTTVRFL